MKANLTKKVAAKQRKSRELKDPDSYEVGYKKPPKWAQWRPGQSGNPSGYHPTSHDKLREQIQAILNEPINDQGMTRLDALLRDMVEIGEARDRTNLLEHGYGKVKEEIDATIHGAIPVQAVDYNESIKAMKPTDAVDE